MGTLKSELEKAVPKVVEALAARPTRTIAEIYADFRDRLQRTPVVDPQGRTIVFRPENFPYLIKMEHRRPTDEAWVAATASVVINALDEGTFDESRHRCDNSRAKGIVWLRHLLTDPDSIHENIHARVKGDFLYVVSVGSDGESKVAFITKNRAGEWILVTSFYTTAKYLKTCAKEPALYRKQKSRR
jgi:hypothetical protein